MSEDPLAAHLREHDLLSDAHRREHEGLLREIAGAAAALDGKVRDTATAFDIRMRDATAQLETRVKEVADLHWSNHRVEHASDARAIDKVESAITTRFESVNEFREQLREQATKFLMRDEYLAYGKSVNDRIVALETFRNQNEGSTSGVRQQQGDTRQNNAALYGLIGVAIAVASFFIARMSP